MGLSRCKILDAKLNYNNNDLRRTPRARIGGKQNCPELFVRSNVETGYAAIALRQPSAVNA
jgi:hypothetical protein